MAKSQPVELTEMAMGRITQAVRSLQDDRIERGVELDTPMHCESCDCDKPSAGSALYGAYKFCNDCLLDFTVALASGRVDSADEFMTRPVVPAAEATLPPDVSSPRERHSLSVNLPGREKLLPRNEPC